MIAFTVLMKRLKFRINLPVLVGYMPQQQHGSNTNQGTILWSQVVPPFLGRFAFDFAFKSAS